MEDRELWDGIMEAYKEDEKEYGTPLGMAELEGGYCDSQQRSGSAGRRRIPHKDLRNGQRKSGRGQTKTSGRNECRSKWGHPNCEKDMRRH